MPEDREIVRFHVPPQSLPEVCGGRPIGLFYATSFDTGRPNLVTVAYLGDVPGQYRGALLQINNLLAGRPFSWDPPAGLRSVDVAVLLEAARLRAEQPLMLEEERRMQLARVRAAFQPVASTDQERNQTTLIKAP